MSGLRISLSVVASIMATGALLNLMNSGTFGVTVAKVSQFVTKGYGV